MTDAEKKTIIQTLVGNDAEATSGLLDVYLADAKETILNRMYPYGVPASITDVPARYERLQCRLVQRYFLRRGAEGEISHNENGINRAYGSVNDEDILSAIVPMAKVVGSNANA